MIIINILLQQGGMGSSNFLVMMLIMILIFYFFMIRPQMKKNKQQLNFRNSIGKGDQIVTSGGIHGKIIATTDTTFTLEIEGGNRLLIEKSAVSMEVTQTVYPKDKPNTKK